MASCDHANPQGARFCVSCGAHLGQRCVRCRAELPADARFCLACGARIVEGTEAGERRQLTVLFCDLVGSMELAAELDPEAWREVLRTYQALGRDVIARHGGLVAQYLGDGLLVYFGWPRAYDDAAERAVRAALVLVEAAATLEARGTALSVRVGLHTGPVVLSSLGDSEHNEILALGETPNLASRVQGLAEPGTVLVSAATQRLVAGLFVVEELGPQALKGVREPVRLYRVLRPSGVRSRLDVAAGRLTPFVGRAVELATLVERWERAQDGAGQSLHVVGDAGVGKSRLVYQMRETIASIPHTWLECGATPYTEGTPFHPVITLVSQALAFAPEHGVNEKLARLTAGLGRLASTETVALLADLFELPHPTPLQMSPELQRRKTIELLAQWSLTLSEAQALVVLVEDLHWCDASSLELLARLVVQNATARVLLLTTSRPEFTPPWSVRENVTTLSLPRLKQRQAREMVSALGGAELATATVDALVARADGVPLFLEELTKSLLEPGAARSVESIPATLADSLMARLDRLSTAKEVAQRAAVLGREFAYPLLEAVADLEAATLRRDLARLREADILYVRGEPPDASYTFKHALVQEAAYESLLHRTRQQLHGRVFELLAADAAAEPERVARHADLAGRIDDAIAYYQRAGEHAHTRSAHEEALGHLRHALELLRALPESRERDAREATLQHTLAGCLAVGSGYAHPEVQPALERARAICEQLGDARGTGLATSGLAMFFRNCGQVGRSAELGTRVLEIANRIGDRDLMNAGHMDVGTAEHYQGRFASSLAHFEAALTAYEPGRVHPMRSIVGDPGLAARSCTAWNLFRLGWPDRALARAREAVALAQQLGQPFTLAYTTFFETVVHALRRDLKAQRDRAAEVIALGDAQGFPFWQGMSRSWHAAARVGLGDAGAIDDLLAGLKLSAGTGGRAGAPGVFHLLGEALVTARRLEEAREAIEAGLRISEQTGQAFFDAELHLLRGEITRTSGGATADAETSLRHALEVARAQGNKAGELRAATGLASLWRDHGRLDEAHALLAPVYAWFTEGLDTGDLVAARAVLETLPG